MGLAGRHAPDALGVSRMHASSSCLQVRYVGVSNETSYGVMKFIQASEQLGLPRIVSIQNSYSLLGRGPFETDLAEVGD